MGYAIFRSGGKQYRVSPGDRVKLEKLNVPEGETVEFSDVLLVRDEQGVKVGYPNTGKRVVARVIAHGRHKKIRVLKFKRRKNYLRRLGHRQPYTEVEILEIKSTP